MKAILVIDMPMDCYECPCSNEGCYLCQIRRRLLEDDFQDRRPSWCPLRPLPELRDEHCHCDNWEQERIFNAESRGFNWCIDEIMGDTE